MVLNVCCHGKKSKNNSFVCILYYLGIVDAIISQCLLKDGFARVSSYSTENCI